MFIALITGILLDVFNLEKMLKKHAGDEIQLLPSLGQQ